MTGTIQVCAEILEAMLRHAQRESEIECCGLLAGREGVITAIFPTRNALASATAYEIAPEELFRLFRRMREQGLGASRVSTIPIRLAKTFPSPRDIEQAYYPDQVYFIISPQAAVPRPVRAFSIRDGSVLELEIVEQFF